MHSSLGKIVRIIFGQIYLTHKLRLFLQGVEDTVFEVISLILIAKHTNCRKKSLCKEFKSPLLCAWPL